MDRTPNRLVHEKSPYLLQHAYNPVDWYPWGLEAFNSASSADKPIFLSIGYATCHWCHVMEQESFNDPDLAKKMNEAFINIKVDREELPEIDHLYMQAAQVLMQTGTGWPLNVLLTPDGTPFFAATYMPKDAMHGMSDMPNMVDMISQVSAMWQTSERTTLVHQGESILALIKESSIERGEKVPDKRYLQETLDLLIEKIDPVFGGMGSMPKFPMSYQLDFLFMMGKKLGDTRPHFLANLTLDKMLSGGIYDQLGGGFSRYAVDRAWRFPHFEKMLYDNALLSRTYFNAYTLTKKEEYRTVCIDTLNYLVRDMMRDEGGFYSAQDADSNGVEGAYYTWSTEEIEGAVADAGVFIDFFGCVDSGEFHGRNVLYRPYTLNDFALTQGMAPEQLETMLLQDMDLLLTLRNERSPLFKDDKILTGWNGLVIDALTCAGIAFGETPFIDAAVLSFEFISSALWDGKTLYRRYRDGERGELATLSDYAFLIKAAITLFEAGLSSKYLAFAESLSTTLFETFKMPDGAFITSTLDTLPVKEQCLFHDGALPSGNGVHAENCLRLYQITKNTIYKEAAVDILKASHQTIQAFPPAACYNVLALSHYYDTDALTIVVALDASHTYREEIIELLFLKHLPHRAIVIKAMGDKALSYHAPFTDDLKAIDHQTTLHICYADRCLEPVTGWLAISQAISAL